uniref:Uncharacterized protein n=1 Tax=Anguilla anguilla TaxID=7936 RepID=A0A0E9SC13_ANGAN
MAIMLINVKIVIGEDNGQPQTPSSAGKGRISLSFLLASTHPYRSS